MNEKAMLHRKDSTPILRPPPDLDFSAPLDAKAKYERYKAEVLEWLRWFHRQCTLAEAILSGDATLATTTREK
jgi:hypothetical protein